MDAVFVCCKGYSLKEACGAISPVVGPETAMIPLLNGVIVSDIMEPLLPPCILADGTNPRVQPPGETGAHHPKSMEMCRYRLRHEGRQQTGTAG